MSTWIIERFVQIGAILFVGKRVDIAGGRDGWVNRSGYRSDKRLEKQSRDCGKPPLQRAELTFLATTDLKPDPRNPRKHDRAQIRAIARSIEAFGFNAPILINKKKQIIAGHGRFDPSKLSGCTQVPVICLEHLTEDQARAYMLADNKLTDRSSWDDDMLALHLKELSEMALDFDIEAIGFELPEIDFRIQSLDITEDTN